MNKIFKVFLLSTLLGVLLQGKTLEQAKAYYEQGLYTQALPLFEKLAQEGDKESNYQLALMYEKGLGVDENITKAMHYYKGSTSFIEKKPSKVIVENTDDDSKMQRFLLHKVGKVDADARSLIERYLSSDFGLYAYKTNYILPFSLASTKYSYWRESGIAPGTDTHDKKYESEFQLSLKKPLAFNLFGLNEAIVFAYTQKVWWQIYSPSAPFRETNYEPELFVTFPTPENIDKQSGLKGVRFGFVHESNGRSGLQSRSWNRLYLGSIWQSGNLFTNFRLWHRISEDDKISPQDFDGDDNPDIEEYLGYGDISISYLYRKQQIGLMLRNNLHVNDNKGSITLDWSTPIPYAKDSFWYIKLFSGYGESLIDYNRHVDKFSLGFSFSRGLF